jgi:hypothetical protein
MALAYHVACANLWGIEDLPFYEQDSAVDARVDHMEAPPSETGSEPSEAAAEPPPAISRSPSALPH